MTIAISGTNGITLDGQFNSASSFGFKNRIINGGMVIDQRNAGASATFAGIQYGLDRWQSYSQTGTSNTLQQVSDAPSGFNNSLKITIGTGASPSAAQQNILWQPIEGYNIADMGFGANGASTFTFSFWTKSSLTGTFNIWLQNSAGNRSYVSTYTINSANTWEQKIITVVGDTTGTWLKTNGAGLVVGFSLGCGSNFNATVNSWSASDYKSTSGATNIVATSGATWQVTGVQLEKGSTATSFDYRPYGTELQLCQRYYEQYKDQIATGYVSVRTGSYYGYITWQVPKRAAPTILNYTSFNFAGSAGDINTVTSAVFDNQQVNNTRFYANSVGPYTAQSAYVYVNGTLSISSEL